LCPLAGSLISLHLTDTPPVFNKMEPISVVALMTTVLKLVSKDSNLVAGGGGQVAITWACEGFLRHEQLRTASVTNVVPRINLFS
jgi:hypothetical protein